MSKFNAKEYIEKRLTKNKTELKLNLLNYEFDFTDEQKKLILLEITNIKSLTTIDLSSNQINEASFLKELRSLTTLNLGNNQIKDYSFLKELKSLTTLDLSSNQINEASFLKELKLLTTLNLGNNQINKASFLKELKSLTTLDLGSNQIKDYSFLKELKSLTTLDLSSNQIRDASFVKELRSLTALNLSRNQISDASFLKELKSLTTLDLTNNQIRDASFLKELRLLTTLYLSNNKISDTSFLKELKLLTTLNLWGNQISDASFLKELRSLSTLNLSRNQINDASFLKELRSLTSLNLSSNQINDASFLKELRSLTTLYLSGNENLNIPKRFKRKYSLNRKIIDRIIEFYEQLESEGEDFIYEAKVLIVGEPNSGKTTLFRKLQDHNYLPQKATKEEKESTIGVDINFLEFPYNEEKQFTGHLWDFGGQEKQYVLHQYFFTERSLYVLLADDRKELGNFNYWFEIIATLGSGCPVMVVLNEINSKVKNFDISVYKKEFGEKIADIEEKSVNFANNDDGRFANLANEIKTKLKNLPHIGQALPKTWVKVRKELSKIEKPLISIDDYEDICEKCGVEKPEYRRQILEYLHDLGIALNYKHDDNLRNKLILKPNWVIDALYAVLKNDGIIKNAGKFTADEVFHLWKGYKADEKTILLQLMQKGKFEVAYKLEGKPAYIAPILLPEIAPKYEFDENDSLQIHFDYTFKPKGIISRLIVRFHENIVSQKGEQKVWKKGVLLQNKNSFARIVESEQRRKIIITVSGKSAFENREFITIISNEIKRIHRDWFEDRLNFKEMVLCNCDECKTSNEPYFFNLESLERKLNKGIETAICDKSDLEIRIRRLLEGIYIEEKKSQRNDLFDRSVFNVEGDLHLSNVSGNENIVVQGVKDSNINIGEFVNNLSAKINESQKSELEALAEKIILKLEANHNLKDDDKAELEEVKKGKWETKIKFSLPFIPLEFSRTVPPEEFIDKVQRWLYGGDLQTNLLD